MDTSPITKQLKVQNGQKGNFKSKVNMKSFLINHNNGNKKLSRATPGAASDFDRASQRSIV